MANISPEVVFGMLFLNLSGTNVDFLDWEIRWKTYTIQEALPTIRRVELVEKKEFAATAFDPEHETFVVHVAFLSSVPSLSSVTSLSSTSLDADIYPSRRPQKADLIAEEAITKVPVEYANFADVFFPDLASKLPKYTEINNHFIKLIDANGFIRPFKSPVGIPDIVHLQERQ